VKQIKKRHNFLPFAKPSIGDQEVQAVGRVLRSGWLTTGPEVTKFEENVRNYIGCNATVGLSSCTGGLHTALHAIGIGPGDEVIVPVVTFAASAHVVHWLGAKPVLADINGDDCTINITEIERLCNPKTKAVMPVHFGGYACDMEAINGLAKEKGLKVVEDAAHIIGGKYRTGENIGVSDNAVLFSFYAIKNMTTAEGGLAASNNIELMDKIRRQSYFGIDKDAFKRYGKSGSWYYEVMDNGFKYNMDSMQAALGNVQLERLDSFNDRRRKLVTLYLERLKDVELIECPSLEISDSVWHLFVIRIKDEASLNRDDLSKRLCEFNIGSSVHFIPLHLHSFYSKRYGYSRGDFPVAERYYKECLSIPLYPSMSENDVEYVCDTIKYILQ